MSTLQVLPSATAFSRSAYVYAEIREIDQAAQNETGLALAPIDARLREIDNELADLNLPPSYCDYAYTARLHIELLRGRIKERMMRED